MTTLHFNYKDMFRSVRLAFSLQRIWIQFTGVLASYAVYLILTYLAFAAGGENLADAWDRYGILPVFPGSYLSVFSIILYAAALMVLIFGYMITATGVARAVYMNLKGNTFYSWKESLRFAWGKKFSILGTPLSLAVLAGFFILGGGFIGLLGRIPFVGAVGLSLFTIVWFLAVLFLLFVGLALAVSVLLTPAILATTDDDAFEGIFQSFSITFSQPWRLLFYQLLNILCGLFGWITLTLLFKYTWRVMTLVFSWGMGEKFVSIAASASYLVQSWTYPFVLHYQAFIGDYGTILFFSHDFTPVALSAAETAASVIMAVFLLILGGYLFSYPMAIINTGHTLSFLAIKKIKDDENLLERHDREEDEDEETDETEAPASGTDETEAEEK